MHHPKPCQKRAHLVRCQRNTLFAWFFISVCTVVLPNVDERHTLERSDDCPLLFAKIDVFIAFAVDLDFATRLKEIST